MVLLSTLHFDDFIVNEIRFNRSSYAKFSTFLCGNVCPLLAFLLLQTTLVNVLVGIKKDRLIER